MRLTFWYANKAFDTMEKASVYCLVHWATEGGCLRLDKALRVLETTSAGRLRDILVRRGFTFFNPMEIIERQKEAEAEIKERMSNTWL